MKIEEWIKRDCRIKSKVASALDISLSGLYAIMRGSRPVYDTCVRMHKLSKGEVGPKDYGYEQVANDTR